MSPRLNSCNIICLTERGQLVITNNAESIFNFKPNIL